LALITVLSCTFYFDDIHRPPYSILFPYTTLFRSILGLFIRYFVVFEQAGKVVEVSFMEYQHGFPRDTAANKSLANAMNYIIGSLDRKSTRLNSSHVKISYAVFCLKKKKKHVSTPF